MTDKNQQAIKPQQDLRSRILRVMIAQPEMTASDVFDDALTFIECGEPGLAKAFLSMLQDREPPGPDAAGQFSLIDVLTEAGELLDKIWTWDGEDEDRRKAVVKKIQATLIGGA